MKMKHKGNYRPHGKQAENSGDLAGGALYRAAKKLLRSGMLPRDVADNLSIFLATLYCWLPAAASSGHVTA